MVNFDERNPCVLQTLQTYVLNGSPLSVRHIEQIPHMLNTLSRRGIIVLADKLVSF